MKHDPDTYLLYESSKKPSFCLRIKVQLDEPVDPEILKGVAEEAFQRFPYFRVKPGLDASQNYILIPNDKPLAVLPEENRRIVLASDEVNDHIKSVYSITDGDLMLEVNALKTSFFITYQLYGKDRKPLERFLEVLDGESIPYKVSDIKTRYLPWVKLPTA